MRHEAEGIHIVINSKIYMVSEDVDMLDPKRNLKASSLTNGIFLHPGRLQFSVCNNPSFLHKVFMRIVHTSVKFRRPAVPADLTSSISLYSVRAVASLMHV